MQATTVLVVGAGVVGSRVARSFAARAHTPDRQPTAVTVWTRTERSARQLAAEGLYPVAAAVDIAAPGGLLPVEKAGYDVVILCAAPDGGAGQDARAVYVDGYGRVLAALEGCARLPRRVVLAGSTGVIGDHAGATVDETVARDTASPRGQVLCTAEDQVRNFAARHSEAGVSAVILRLVGLYGPARNPLAALRAGRYRYPGDPGKGINLLHVTDAAAALVAGAALAVPAGQTEIIHCSDGQFPTRREYLAAICRRFDLPLPAVASTEAGPAKATGAGGSLGRGAGDRRITNDKMLRMLLPTLIFPSHVEGIDSFEGPGGTAVV